MSPSANLVGRRRECAVLDDLVAGLRAGDSAVCAIRGEAGIGKSVLLDYVAEKAAGITVTRTQGIEADMELAYASLHQLCAPFLTVIDGEPGRCWSLSTTPSGWTRFRFRLWSSWPGGCWPRRSPWCSPYATLRGSPRCLGSRRQLPAALATSA
ncbi:MULTISPECIES: ATP-binding protein [unclassified Kribbella]|uniref:ATP-binding protein n=1 Tax=unclassified Kribbella TaxID=2644121 RepID=UPI0033FC7AAB